MNINALVYLDVARNMSPSSNAVTTKAALILCADEHTVKSCTHYFLRHPCIVPARSSTSGEQNKYLPKEQGGMIKVENATQIRPHMKANELKKLSFVRPFHLVGMSVHDRPHNKRDKAKQRQAQLVVERLI